MPGCCVTQRFGFDLMPLVLLFAIAVTGLALTASSLWWEGRYYWFISLTHQVVVVAWLLSLPFGKFFHIVQRPASHRRDAVPDGEPGRRALRTRSSRPAAALAAAANCRRSSSSPT